MSTEVLLCLSRLTRCIPKEGVVRELFEAFVAGVFCGNGPEKEEIKGSLPYQICVYDRGYARISKSRNSILWNKENNKLDLTINISEIMAWDLDFQEDGSYRVSVITPTNLYLFRNGKDISIFKLDFEYSVVVKERDGSHKYMFVLVDGRGCLLAINDDVIKCEYYKFLTPYESLKGTSIYVVDQTGTDIGGGYYYLNEEKIVRHIKNKKFEISLNQDYFNERVGPITVFNKRLFFLSYKPEVKKLYINACYEKFFYTITGIDLDKPPAKDVKFVIFYKKLALCIPEKKNYYIIYHTF